MARKNMVVANWKMNLLLPEAIKLTHSIGNQVSSSRNLEIVLCPPFPYLSILHDQLKSDNRHITLGAQNCSVYTKGAFTGEISADMIASTGCKYVIIGHSERRTLFDESDEMIKQKIGHATRAGLNIILCVGETLEEREKGIENDVIHDQLTKALSDTNQAQMENIIIAYEPVWAIGTGKTATPQQVQKMHLEIRKIIAYAYSQDLATQTIILYGGSVNSKTAKELFELADVDGGLIGSASLDEPHFISIVRIAQSIL